MIYKIFSPPHIHIFLETLADDREQAHFSGTVDPAPHIAHRRSKEKATQCHMAGSSAHWSNLNESGMLKLILFIILFLTDYSKEYTLCRAVVRFSNLGVLAVIWWA